MITRIAGYSDRCFPNLAVDLDWCHVLAGANGAGKTALLYSVKPPLPKEALGHLKRQDRAQASNAEFGKLADAMSVSQCQGLACIQLRHQLRAWFPEQP